MGIASKFRDLPTPIIEEIRNYARDGANRLPSRTNHHRWITAESSLLLRPADLPSQLTLSTTIFNIPRNFQDQQYGSSIAFQKSRSRKIDRRQQ
jgi:hypothetical protein